MIWRSKSELSLLPLLGGFILLSLTAAGAVYLSLERAHVGMSVRHALEAVNGLNYIQMLVVDAETGQRGYLLTGKLSYLDPYESGRRQLTVELDKLDHVVTDNPVQMRAVQSLRSLFAAKLRELQKTVDLRASGHPDEALAVVNDDIGDRMMVEIRTLIGDMRAEENRIIDERGSLRLWLNGTAELMLFISMFGVFALGAFTLYDASRRLRAVQAVNHELEREVSTRHSAEGQVRQLQKMEAVGQLTSGIAHDFNNMLAIVLGSLDMARRYLTGTENPAVLKYIDNAADGANRAAALTARLLAFSRQQPLQPTALDANKLVGGMAELLRRTIGEQIHFETVLVGGLWKAFADPTQLESALVNLAINARDAMPDGGKLTMETGNVELDERYATEQDEVTAGQYVLISVTDTGIGMAPEVIDRAFDPFYTTKGVGKGTGLGLSQVFGFVKQSRGHVAIYSEIGQGTTVKIYLPRFVGEAPAVQEGALTELSLAGKKEEVILLVEDDLAVRTMTVDALRDLGYTVVHAGLPSEALRLLEAQPRVALLFTDIVMPEMTGRELADRAQARKPDLKVLFTTGYTRNAIVHNGMVDYGTAFLPKPFTQQQLAAKVRQTIGQ